MMIQPEQSSPKAGMPAGCPLSSLRNTRFPFDRAGDENDRKAFYRSLINSATTVLSAECNAIPQDTVYLKGIGAKTVEKLGEQLPQKAGTEIRSGRVFLCFDNEDSVTHAVPSAEWWNLIPAHEEANYHSPKVFAWTLFVIQSHA